MKRLLPALIVLALLMPVAAAADDLESRARELETLIMAPCCGGGTVADHVSPASDQVRREVREMLADGMSKQQILDHYVAEHGDTILSMPPARGFNLIAYWVPFLALFGGGALVLVLMRQWRARHPVAEAVAPSPSAAPAADLGDYEDRVKKQLEAMD